MKLKLLLFASLIFSNAFAASLTDLSSEKAPFKLPALPYKTADLAPVIDDETMQIHHGKHHKAYIDKLNNALSESDKKRTLGEILQSLKNYSSVVRNNAGGHWNHSFFWTILSPASVKTEMSAELKTRIQKDFGSIDKFKEQFEKQALEVFGSGWVWLIVAADGKLQITTTQNQDNPLMDIAMIKGQPILGLDVWEHAYYLSYQNKRAEYVKKFWAVVNWTQVSEYFSNK